MKKIKVTCIKQDDLGIITDAAKLTQIRGYVPQGTSNEGLVARLILMGHWAPLEFADMTVFIQGCSRVFLAQITRHRLVSFMSSSQQYQDHSNFDYVTPEALGEADKADYTKIMSRLDWEYRKLASSIGKDDARYLLPNACRVDLLMKANLREWLSVIIPQRICKRNTPETVHIMKLICEHLPFNMLTGPACITTGHCDQGKMACNDPYTCTSDLLP